MAVKGCGNASLALLVTVSRHIEWCLLCVVHLIVTAVFLTE